MEKREFLFIVLLSLCLFSYAQVYENPTFERSDVPAFYIRKVKITKDTTYVFCSFYAVAGSCASISKDTYLRDSKSYKTFPLQRCEGLPYTPNERSLGCTHWGTLIHFLTFLDFESNHNHMDMYNR